MAERKKKKAIRRKCKTTLKINNKDRRKNKEGRKNEKEGNKNEE